METAEFDPTAGMSRTKIVRLTGAALIPVATGGAFLIRWATPGNASFIGLGLLGLVGALALARPFSRAGVVAGVVATVIDGGLLASRGFDIVNGYMALLVSGAVFLAVGILCEMLASGLDASERRAGKALAALDDLTDTDSLTGTLRWRFGDKALSEEVERARRYGRSLSVIILGFDDWPGHVRLKGRAKSERSLSAIGRGLLKQLRAIDKVGRYGEAKFALILPETARLGAEIVARRSLELVLQTTGLPARAGIAEFPVDGDKGEDLAREAEAALEFAIAAGLDVASSRLLVSAEAV